MTYTIHKPNPLLAVRLRQTREVDTELTQRQVSELVGISVRELSDYERGYREPSIPVLRRIAFVLGTTPERLLRPLRKWAPVPTETPLPEQSGEDNSITQ